MKKALASIVLLASSAGLFALPAAARDRDDHVSGRNSGYTSSYSNYARGDHNNYARGDYNNYGRGDYNNYARRDGDHDRWEGRRVNVRDYRGGYGYGVTYSAWGRNCR
jgi:hypothetical protein